MNPEAAGQMLDALASPDQNTRTTAEAQYHQLAGERPHELKDFLMMALPQQQHTAFASILLRRLITSTPSLVTSPLIQSCLHVFSTSTAYAQRMLSHLLAQSVSSLPECTGDIVRLLEGSLGSEKQSLYLLQQLFDYSPLPTLQTCIQTSTIPTLSSSFSNPSILPSLLPCVTSLIISSTKDPSSSTTSLPMLVNEFAEKYVNGVMSSIQSSINSDSDSAVKALLQMSSLTIGCPTFFSTILAKVTSSLNSVTSEKRLDVSIRLNSGMVMCNVVAGMRKEVLACQSSTAAVAGTMSDLIVICRDHVDTDVDSWLEDAPTFEPCQVWDEDDDSLAAESYLEALFHDLGGRVSLPVVISSIQTLGTSWQSKRALLAVLERLFEACPVASKSHALQAVNLATEPSPNPRVIHQSLQLLGCLCNKSYVDQSDPKVLEFISNSLTSTGKVVKHACAALISYCKGGTGCTKENLLPFLQPVMSRLQTGPLSHVNTTSNPGSPPILAAGISSIAAVASVVEEAFEPFYGVTAGLIQVISMGITAEGACGNANEPSEMQTLRGKALEAFSIVGEAVGGKDCGPFVQDANNVMGLVIKYFQYANKLATLTAAAATNQTISIPPLPIPMDDVQSSCARISGMMGDDFVQFLPALLPHLLRQAKAKNEMEVEDCKDGEVDGDVQEDFEGGTQSMTMKIPGVGLKKITLNTNVVQEKAQASRALYEHAAALGSKFAPFAKVCSAAMIPNVSFQYNAEVRSTSAQALAPIFEASLAYATDEAVGGKPVTPAQRLLPQQLFSSICNTIVKQLSEERGDPDTMVALAGALSDVTGDAYRIFMSSGKSAAKLTDSEGRQLVTSLTTLAGECLDRRRQLFEGMRVAQDEDEVAEYEEALDAESELLTPLVDSIGYTLKSAGEAFGPSFNAVIAPNFGKMLEVGDDTRARFAAVCLFDDCVEHLGKAAAAQHAPALLNGVLAGIDDSRNGGDGELKQAAVYGVAQIARQAPHVLAAQATNVLAALCQIVQTGARDEDEVSLVENAVSALSTMVLFKKARFTGALGSEENINNVKELVLNNFPIKEDETEAHLCHENLADLIEIGDASCVGTVEKVARTMSIISSVLQAVEEGDDVAAPSTCARFAGLLVKLQGHQHAQGAFGMLNGEQQGIVGKAVQQVEAPATITP
ncbi:hypothetical protein TL16_g00584 [Triparma laevis f. inornata]|uniref:Uncharacterized protein n=1 Tax=Triparma laevis f. inornata TaxID=1714386 RepID=A0A9W7DN33_9STRA|nr:hypothetical protein TL16_g00584 [Triparma laevis f. inornata]